MIFGTRIRQAREFLGEKQTDFGEAIGLRQSALSQAENSVSELADGVVAAMAEHCGFPIDFFQRAPATEVGELQFRARLRFKAADRNRAVRASEIVHEAFELMRQEVNSVPVHLPVGTDPVLAAREVRSMAGLHPHEPIANLIIAMERLGVVVLALPVVGKKHDAFCWWHHDARKPYPVVATLMGSAGDRLRWSVAHEVGHAVLHRDGGGGPAIEREADEFAAELLTPLAALRGEMPAAPRLANLYAMKARWGVSVQSLIRRAKDLGAVDDDRYISLFRQISARGERMNERYEITREKPRAFRKTAEVVFADSTVDGLAALARWTPTFSTDVLAQFASRNDLNAQRIALRSHDQTANVIPIRRQSTR